ncbi:MAG: hypothetical protein U5K54_01360 [Cytophagales bacterium]|nr:hypothetical protein [Cytophagales bacterium]
MNMIFSLVTGTMTTSMMDGVTEFVEKLNQELDATLKDKLSIYFDKNPKEGLQETHHVDQSTPLPPPPIQSEP